MELQRPSMKLTCVLRRIMMHLKNVIPALVAWVLLATPILASGPLFDARIDYQTGREPFSVFAADFNGDGKPDLAVANYADNTVSILMNNGDGTFSTAVDYGVGSGPWCVYAADFDGDGRPDLAVANSFSNTISILKNNGNGTFASAVNYGVGNNPISVFAADLDGDGTPDLAVANAYPSNSVSILKNHGDGTFGGWGNYSVQTSPLSVFAADFDGDSKPDLAVANYGSNTVSILTNNGNGTFASAVNYGVLSYPHCVFAADFDGDSKPDLAVANNGPTSVSILKNNGNGTFASAVNYDGGGGISIFAVDFDADSRPDLAAVGGSSTFVSILKNNGNGTFAGAVDYEVGSSPHSVFSADLDGDGKPDLAVANRYSNTISILKNRSNDIAPTVTSPNTESATEDSRFVYHATATDPDGPILIWSYIDRPSWLTSDADSIFGTPHYGNHDTSFVVIVSDGFLSDTQLVAVVVSQITPEVRAVWIDSDTLNLHVIDETPHVNWFTYDPTGSPAQTQFEIAVGTDTNWTNSEMWNPVTFSSPDTFVTYLGSSLIDGAMYYLRLRVNNGHAWSNWYYTSFRMNTPPTIPSPYAPTRDTVMQTSYPWLYLTNSMDAEGDSLSYDYYVLTDTWPPLLIDTASHVPQMPTRTHWIVALALVDDGRFRWLARAFDGYEYSPWSDAHSFWVNAIDEPPTPPVLLAPPTPSGLPVFDLRPTFHWTASTDPDPLDTIHYRVDLSLNSIFQPPSSYENVFADSLVLSDSLDFGTRYWWRVRAIDKTGLYAVSTPSKSFWTWELGDVDHSHGTDISDLSKLIDHLYISFTPITPLKVADMDGDCRVDISDLTKLIDRLYISFTPLDVGCEP
jgi:hypothetical protein